MPATWAPSITTCVPKTVTEERGRHRGGDRLRPLRPGTHERTGRRPDRRRARRTRSSNACARLRARPRAMCCGRRIAPCPRKWCSSSASARAIPANHCAYCSKICCMYTAKHASLYKHHVPDGRAYVFYIDIRSGGKGYEEFVQRTMEERRGHLFARSRFQAVSQGRQGQGAGHRHPDRAERRDRRRHGGAGAGHGAVARARQTSPRHSRSVATRTVSWPRLTPS